MKSYTDIDQSKKLAKILPLESADMRFCFSHTLGGRITGHYPMIGREPSLGTISCWSLAALLGVLPQGEYKDADLCFGGYKGDEYIPEWFCSYEQQEPFIIEICHADNPVDACYEMILKLHELNLL